MASVTNVQQQNDQRKLTGLDGHFAFACSTAAIRSRSIRRGCNEAPVITGQQMSAPLNARGRNTSAKPDCWISAISLTIAFTICASRQDVRR